MKNTNDEHLDEQNEEIKWEDTEKKLKWKFTWRVNRKEKMTVNTHNWSKKNDKKKIFKKNLRNTTRICS